MLTNYLQFRQIIKKHYPKQRKFSTFYRHFSGSEDTFHIFQKFLDSLSDLKNVQWTWSEAKQKIFEELNKRLISLPVL